MKSIFTNLRLILLFSLLISAAFLSCTSTKVIDVEEGWELLGEGKVNFVRDRDEISVKSRNQFTAIRFKVEEKDIILKDLEVVFDNGDKLSPAIEEDLSAGETSRVIELAKDGRYIDKIGFSYRSTGNILRGRANVLVFGKRYERNW